MSSHTISEGSPPETLPTGTVTFVFTDIEGSTRMLQAQGDAYAGLLERHRRLIRGPASANGGLDFGSEGDAEFLVFRNAPSAIAAAVEAQRGLAAEPWPEGAEIRVRMGIHTGEATLLGGDYVGLDLHRVARIAATGHGGQVVVSGATAALVNGALPDGVTMRDLGERRLKDLSRPEHLYQLVISGLRSDFPPLRTLDVLITNLPTQVTSFVGREREVAASLAILRSARLLTLTGPGGTGKTRLSLQVAAEAAGDFPDGVFFVPLESVTDPALVPTAINIALGVQDTSLGPSERLLDHLQSRRTLLVLDNFEQVLAAAPLVTDILRASPGTKVIVTSRAALRVSGEKEFPVPPLGVPAMDDAAAATGAPAPLSTRRASPPPRASRCSWNARWPSDPTSGSRRRTQWQWRRSALGSMGSRSPSNWPPPAASSSRRRRSCRVSGHASGSSPVARATCPSGSRPSAERSRGATTSSTSPCSGSSGACRSSWAVAASTKPKPSVRPTSSASTSSTASRTSWTRACCDRSSRPASRGSRCSRRSATSRWSSSSPVPGRPRRPHAGMRPHTWRWPRPPSPTC
jgi:class 3 adenylate cyclase